MKPGAAAFIAVGLLAVLAVFVVLGFAHFVIDVATHVSNTLNPEGK